MSSDIHGWLRTWRDLGQSAGDEALYRRLIASWSEPHRHYHAPQHLHECMTLFDEVRGLARRPGEVALGLWFHDAYYDTHRKDNEARSAQWAAQSVRDAGLDEAVAQRVHALIMATVHEQEPQDPDARLLVDIDLATLGADTERFEESNRQIRAEFAHVPQDEFREGRKRVLNRFLARPRIYSTVLFYDRLEVRARENLRNAIARLDAGSSPA